MVNCIKKIGVFMLLLLFVVPVACSAEVLECPEFSGYVYDYANVISASDEVLINFYAEAVDNIEAGQVIVVTVDSLSGMTAADYSLELFNSWGIGRANVNDGLLILFAPRDGEIYLCTGSGIDTQITDEDCGTLIDEFALQKLIKGDYSAGMVSLTKAACLKLVVERNPLFDDKEMLEAVVKLGREWKTEPDNPINKSPVSPKEISLGNDVLIYNSKEIPDVFWKENVELRIGNENQVRMIRIEDENIETYRGISVGDPVSRIESSYLFEHQVQNMYMVYFSEEGEIDIESVDGKFDNEWMTITYICDEINSLTSGHIEAIVISDCKYNKYIK